jgi:hypothetical protein
MLTTRPPVTPDDLDAWIAELRGRLARRELDGSDSGMRLAVPSVPIWL